MLLAELDPQLAATGSTLVDAPILGAPPVVSRRRPRSSSGARPAGVERVRPVLELLGEVRQVGALGSGARLKLVANSMLGAVITAAAELQTAGEAAGLDPGDVFSVLARLAPSLEMRRSGLVDRRHEPTLFAVRDLRKDLDLALDTFHHAEARVPVTALVRELVDEAVADVAGLDISAVITRYRPATAAPAGRR